MKRLSQGQRIERLLSDGKPHSTPEILRLVYGSEHHGTARIASRIHDLRSRGLVIEGWKDANDAAIFWYRMTVGVKKKMVPVFFERDGIRMVRLVPEDEATP